MKKHDSHMASTSTSSLRLLPEVGLVDLADRSLPEQLAGKVSDQLEVFAAAMRQGLLAASVAIGLEVMGDSSTPRSPRSPVPKAAMTRTGSPTGTAPRTAR